MKFCSNLGVVTHKIIYKKGNEYFTSGGFPRQMNALKMVFRSVEVCAPVKTVCDLPDGLQSLTKIGIKIEELPYVSGNSIGGKLYLLWKLPLILWRIRKFLGKVEIVEVRIPNYIGLIGAFIAKYGRKPAFIWLGGNWWERILSYRKTRLRLIIAKVIRYLIYHLTNDFLVFILDPLMISNSRNINSKNFIPVVSTSIWDREISKYPKNLSKPLSILYVGRLSEEKGTEILIESMGLLKKEISEFDWELTIVGDGPLMEKLKDKVKILDIENKVKFVGRVHREKINKFYDKAHIIIVPSLSETFPKVIVEAMSFGVVVIASKVGAIGYFLNNDQCILLDKITPEEIAKAVKSIIENPEKYAHMSKEGLNFAQSHTLNSLNKVMVEAIKNKFNLSEC